MKIPQIVLDDYRGPTVQEMPNLPVYAWYCNERERIRLRREERKLPKPWTKDPIFQNFRFTNVFRQDDHVSRDLCGAILTSKPKDQQLFNTVVFRTFNKKEGFLAATGGWCREFNQREMLAGLVTATKQGTKLWGNAYLIVNSLMDGGPKYEVFVNVTFPQVWAARKDLLQAMRANPSLQATTQLFRGFTGYAGFLAYEMALDMEMIGLLDYPIDRFTWANPGPGARRGLNFVFGRPRDYRQPERGWHNEMTELMRLSPKFLHNHISRKEWDMRCIENGLCETSKYASVLLTGRAKRRYPGAV